MTFPPSELFIYEGPLQVQDHIWRTGVVRHPNSSQAIVHRTRLPMTEVPRSSGGERARVLVP